MGNNLRLLADNLAGRIDPTVTSVAAGFERANVADGNRYTLWKQAGALADPTAAPSLAQTATGGSLSNGTYLVRYTWKTAGGETLVSPQASIVLTGGTSTQKIDVTAAALPTGATGIKVYAEQSPNTETRQGESATNLFTITTIVAGAAMPTANTAFPEQIITWDAGAGKTETADVLVLARADLLAAAGATVIIEYSTDLSAWTAAFTAVALTAGMMLKPTDQDWLQEFTSQTKRGWRLRIYGMTAAAQVAEISLGIRNELSRNPSVDGPATYGIARKHRGADLSLSWENVPEALANTLMTYVANVTPAWPLESPVETVAGVPHGALPHFLYDPTGNIFRLGAAGQAALLHVLCLEAPQEAAYIAFRVYQVGPYRYRQLV